MSTSSQRRRNILQENTKIVSENAVSPIPGFRKLNEFLDTLQETAKNALGFETLQFIDKTIYPKIPAYVKKILNMAYLENKPYNDIVLHLEREMRLNGVGAPDEVTLVLLNKIEPAQVANKKTQRKSR